MPYSKLKDAPANIRKLNDVALTLAQVNLVAEWADAMEEAEDGPESPWAAAIAQFKKLYQVKGDGWVKREKAAATETGEVQGLAKATVLIKALREIGAGLESFSSQVRSAFYAVFRRRDYSTDVGPVEPYMWIKDVFVEHPDLGDAVVVDKDGALWSVSYSQDDEAFTFAAPEDWERVRQTYVKVSVSAEAIETTRVTEVKLNESASGRAVAIVEDNLPQATDARAPLLLDVVLIEPGFGNAADGHYYPRETLERDADVFAGVKMYTTDHRQEEKNVRTEVATITEITGFTDDGAPIGRVAIHDPGFAEATRNRAKLGTLNSLECSILATGRAKKGSVNGQTTKIVEAITEAYSVDFVSQAGAGGRALALVESDEGGNMDKKKEKQEQQEQREIEESAAKETEVVILAEGDAAQIIEASTLPATAKKRLTGQKYETEQAVVNAVVAEVAYLKEITGSGKVFGQGISAEPTEQRLSEADLQKRLDEVDRRHGLYVKEGE